MNRLRSPVLATLLASMLCHVPATQAADDVSLKFEKFELDNGLTVVVHENHNAPVVAVSIWYRVGSADEPAGRTGFAHLFEHLMFSGSENHKGSYFAPFEKAGVSGMNGTTWLDRTNYFETVPTTALDMALWMESDRMGHLLGAIGQKELDMQRGVVQNEKRENENRPYGRVDENILRNIFPKNHGYHHDTLGSMADLDAATLGDVKNWFRANYGAANTTLVLAGDITPAAAKKKVERYFGDIPAGPPVAHQRLWITPLTQAVNGVQHDHVAQPRIIRTWVAPQLGSDDAVALDLATTVLGGGKTSRLYQRLVYRDQLADAASAGIQLFALASQLQVEVDVRQGIDPAKVEAVIDEEVQRFLAEGPSEDELVRAKVAYRATFVRELQTVGAQASILAEGQIYQGDPGAYQRDVKRVEGATTDRIKDAAARWFGREDYRLTVLPADGSFDPVAEDDKVAGLGAAPGRPATQAPPAQKYRVRKSEVDRGRGVPEVTSFPDLTFPVVQRGKLKNGVEVILAERHSIPLTLVELQFDAGYAAEQGRKLGTAEFTVALLNEGTQHFDATEVAKRRERLGARITTSCDLDTCSVSLNALNDQLAPSLALLADGVSHPAFSAADIDRVRDARLAELAQAKTDASDLGMRLLQPLLYGEGHAYAVPHGGLGSEADIKSSRATDFAAFARDWLRPDNMKIFVAGDTTLAQILPQLNAVLGDWQAPETAVPKKTLRTVAAHAGPRLFLVDRPDAPQSVIVGGLIAPSSKAPDYLALDLANDAFGGSFTSRVNMNLREDKHWAYGAHSGLAPAAGQRPMMLQAPVQTDKTAESLSELLKETRAAATDRPLTDAELAKVKEKMVRAMPGSYESLRPVLAAMSDIVKYGRPADSIQTLKARTEAVTAKEANRALQDVIKPESIVWVVVGDLRKIETPLRSLGISEVRVLDVDGHVVR